jgi:hypothetical protein
VPAWHDAFHGGLCCCKQTGVFGKTALDPLPLLLLLLLLLC